MTSTAPYPHDDEYYMATIVFLVDDYLFKVPRYYFASCSDIFSDIFSLPPGEGGDKDVEGSSDERPFHLEGISRSDFKSFLKVMYPLTTILGGESALSKAEWIAVLKLSTLWNFRDIRQHAITRLSDLPACGVNALTSVEKVSLAKAYKVPRWLLRGYHELVQRTKTITVEEARGLGLETAVGLYQIREQIAASSGTSGGHIPEYSGFGYAMKKREDQTFLELVKRGFKEELEEVEAASRMYDVLPATLEF